jgi:hypothetical protein
VPEVGHGVTVTGIGLRLEREDVRVEVVPVGQQALVERSVNSRFDLAAEEIAGGTDDVVAGIPGHHLGFQRLVRVIRVVDHLDTGARLKLRNGVLADVIGPVVDVQFLGLCRRGARGRRPLPAAEQGSECHGDREGRGTRHGSHAYSFTITCRTTV